MKKKILHIITGLEVGGAETNLARLLPSLEKEFENRVVCLMGKGAIGKKLAEKNVPVYYLHLNGVLAFFNPRAIFRFRKIIQEFQPEILETYLIHADIFGRVWGRIFGVKKIICSHRGSLLQWQWLSFVDKITSFLVTKYVFQTPSAQKKISKKLGINLNKTLVIPNVIDLKDFEFALEKREKLRQLSIKEGNFNIVSVSNLRKGKGHKYLIEAFEQLHASPHFQGGELKRGLKLLLVGDGDQKSTLQKQATICESKDDIYFLGRRSDVLEILKISNLFVLPTFYEGMSNAIMEAMASGLPIITTSIDVNKDLIRDGYSGILVPVADSQAICDNIIKLLRNPEERLRLGKNALVEIKNNYSLEKITARIADLFKSL